MGDTDSFRLVQAEVADRIVGWSALVLWAVAFAFGG